MNTTRKGLALSQSKGFTLLELLIVIAILAVLATIAVLVINPVEYLRQARDSQRINDLAAVKGALDLFSSGTTTPFMAAGCFDTQGTVNPFTSMTLTCTTRAAVTTDGNGWVPANLAVMAGGSPLPKLPIDPTNSGAYFYAIYATNTDAVTGTPAYEMDAVLESAKYTTAPNNMMLNDGGSNTSYYEVGSKISY